LIRDLLIINLLLILLISYNIGIDAHYTTLSFIEKSTEYPSACWRDESGSP